MYHAKYINQDKPVKKARNMSTYFFVK